MNKTLSTKPKSRKTTSKPIKARQDVVLKAIPHVVEALTTIVLNSKNDNFKKKCCRMFKVDDLNSIATCVETNLWKITQKRFGILQPKNSKEQQQSASDVRKDDFEDILFFSNTALVNIPKELSTRDQFHDRTTKNVCCTKPPSNNENENCSFSKLSSNENDLRWDLPDDNLECHVREPSFGTCNECSRMPHFSVPSSHGLYNLQQREWENNFKKTKEDESNNLSLKCKSDSDLGLNHTLLQMDIQQQGSFFSEPSDDGDWLKSYVHDSFWMDNSCIKASQDSSNNLEKITKTDFENHSVTKEFKKKATSCASLRKDSDPKNIDYPLPIVNGTQNFGKAGELQNNLEVQFLVSDNYNELLEISNDNNFEELVNFT